MWPHYTIIHRSVINKPCGPLALATERSLRQPKLFRDWAAFSRHHFLPACLRSAQWQPRLLFVETPVCSLARVSQPLALIARLAVRHPKCPKALTQGPGFSKQNPRPRTLRSIFPPQDRRRSIPRENPPISLVPAFAPSILLLATPPSCVVSLYAIVWPQR